MKLESLITKPNGLACKRCYELSAFPCHSMLFPSRHSPKNSQAGDLPCSALRLHCVTAYPHILRLAMSIVDIVDLPIIIRGNIAKCKTNTLLSEPSKSTLWRHARGKPSRRDKATKQQYLTPCEEKALLEYVLRMSERG